MKLMRTFYYVVLAISFLAVSVISNNSFTMPKTLLFCLGVELILLFHIGQSIFSNQTAWLPLNKNLFKNKLLIGVLSLLVVSILSTVFAVNPAISFFGNYFRLNGLWFFIHLLIFVYYTVLLFKNDYKKLVGFLMIIVSTVSLYGVFQYFSADHYTFWDTRQLGTRIFSTIGQPNYLGYLLVLVLPLYYYLYKISSKYKYLVLAGGFVSVVALLMTMSRGAWIGLIGASSLFTIYWIYKKNRVISILLTVIFLCLISVLSIYGSTFSQSIDSPILRRAVKIVDIDSPTLKSRFILWEASWNLFKENPLIGVGMDNIQDELPKYMSLEVLRFEGSEKVPDRTHNLFIDILLSHGIVGLVAYLLFYYFFITCLLSKLRSKSGNEKLLYQSILFGLTSYLIALQVGFSTIVDQVVFWIFVAITIGESLKITTIAQDKNKISIIAKVVFGLILILLAFNWNLKPLYADYLLKKAISDSSTNYALQAVKMSPSGGLNIYYALEFLRKDIQKSPKGDTAEMKKYVIRTEELLEMCFKNFEQKSLCQLSKARYLDTVGTLIGDEELFEQAILSFQDSITYNPLNVRAYYEQGLVYSKLGQCEKVKPLIQKYLDLAEFPDDAARVHLKQCGVGRTESFK